MPVRSSSRRSEAPGGAPGPPPGPVPKVRLRDVGKTYAGRRGDVEALRGVDLTVAEGEFICLLGPSGCGKSTLLRIIAGLFVQSKGEVEVTTSSRRLATALVFQEYAIFPWRSVLDNVAFGLEMQGVDRATRREVAAGYVERVGLTRFAHHYPHQLSGGMKQRVALARAFASDPEILLMDEPFGALDAQTRSLLQAELMRIWEEERKTVLYVTHSLEEALLLGDRVVLMAVDPGRIKATYPVELPRPRSLRMRTLPAFNRLVDTLWDGLAEELEKVEQR